MTSCELSQGNIRNNFLTETKCWSQGHCGPALLWKKGSMPSGWAQPCTMGCEGSREDQRSAAPLGVWAKGEVALAASQKSPTPGAPPGHAVQEAPHMCSRGFREFHAHCLGGRGLGEPCSHSTSVQHQAAWASSGAEAGQ